MSFHDTSIVAVLGHFPQPCRDRSGRAAATLAVVDNQLQLQLTLVLDS